MTNNFEAGRDKLIADYRVKFSRLGSIQKHIVFEDTEPFTNIYEESNLLFAFLEKILCLNFWSWFHKEKGIHVDDFIKERPLTDTSYQYSRVMLDKIYDITGYLCGHRIFDLLSLNHIKRDYRDVFEEFYLIPNVIIPNLPDYFELSSQLSMLWRSNDYWNCQTTVPYMPKSRRDIYLLYDDNCSKNHSLSDLVSILSGEKQSQWPPMKSGLNSHVECPLLSGTKLVG